MLLTIMCMCGLHSFPTQLFFLTPPHTESQLQLLQLLQPPALPIPLAQGLGGSLVHSTLLPVIFANPTSTVLLHCQLSLHRPLLFASLLIKRCPRGVRSLADAACTGARFGRSGVWIAVFVPEAPTERTHTRLSPPGVSVSPNNA